MLMDIVQTSEALTNYQRHFKQAENVFFEQDQLTLMQHMFRVMNCFFSTRLRRPEPLDPMLQDLLEAVVIGFGQALRGYHQAVCDNLKPRHMSFECAAAQLYMTLRSCEGCPMWNCDRCRIAEGEVQ